MNYIWLGLVAFALFCAMATGKMSELSGAVIAGGSDAITLVLKLAGIICFWNGLMAVAEKSGLTKLICKLFGPFLRLVFPKLKNEKAKSAMAMNLTANLLGLGSAATPFGLEAMKRLGEDSLDKTRATNEMVCFVVTNSAALHLIPTTVALMRQEAGSASPMEVLLPSLLTSLAALTTALLMTKLLERFFR